MMVLTHVLLADRLAGAGPDSTLIEFVAVLGISFGAETIGIAALHSKLSISNTPSLQRSRSSDSKFGRTIIRDQAH